MEIQPYLKYISSIQSFNGDIAIIAETAFVALSKKELPVLPNETILYLLENGFMTTKEGKVDFENHASLVLAVFFLIQQEIKNSITDEDLAKIITLISKDNFEWKRKLIGYQFYDLSCLILNKIYQFNFCQFIISNRERSKRIQMTFFDIFSFLDCEINELCDALIIITAGIKAEHNYVTLHQNIIDKSKLIPEFGRLIISKTKDLPEKDILFVPFAFIGITMTLGIENTFFLLEEFLKSQEVEKIRLGLNCLQKLNTKDDNLKPIESKLSALLENIEKTNKDYLYPDLIITYGLLIQKLKISRKKLTFLATGDIDEKGLAVLAYIVAQNMAEMLDEEWFKISLTRLGKLPSLHQGVIRNLEMGFYRIRKEHPQIFFLYISNFIHAEDNNLTNLDGFKHLFEQIADEDLNMMESLLTEYFNNDDPRFQIAATKISNILSLHAIKELAFNPTIINGLSIYDIEFIIHKVAGFIFSEEHLQSLIYSLTFFKGNRKEEASDLIVDIFSEYIVYNYPSSMDYLKSKLADADDHQKKIIERIQSIEKDAAKPKKVKPNELNGSPERVQMFMNQFSKGFNRDDSTQPFKEPSFMDMITKINIKVGRYFFTRDDLEFGLKNQYDNKAELKSISSTFTMPTGVMTDPIGQEYNRYKWRTFKRQRI